MQLLGDEPLRTKYFETLARRVFLNRVMERLNQIDKRPEIEPEFYRYQAALVQGQLDKLQEEINQMSQQYPQIREYALEELREELLAIEAETYAEFVRAGRLNEELLPFLQEVIKNEDESQ